jgi:hypothetical protein
MDWELILEAERRGILPPDKAELLAEARKRGLVPGEAQAVEPTAQPIPEPAAEQAPQPEPMQPAAQAVSATPTAPTDMRAYGVNVPPPVQQQPDQAAPELTYRQTFNPPQTTAAGVLGAVTRGVAPVATGAALGGAVGGPPGAAIGAGTMAAAPVVLDPAVRAFNERFGTNYPTVSQAFQDLLTRVGVSVPATPQSALLRLVREEFRRVLLLQQALREQCKLWFLRALFLRALPRQCALAAWVRPERVESVALLGRVCVPVLARLPG